MSRFTNQAKPIKLRKLNTSVTLLSQPGSAVGSDEVASAFTEAVYYLRAAADALTDPTPSTALLTALNFYFLMGVSPANYSATAHVLTVRGVVSGMLTSLTAGKHTIKVGTLGGKDIGQVMGRWGLSKEEVKSHYVKTTNMQTGRTEYQANIKLDDKVFTGGVAYKAALTLIHEASHRFCGTVDRFYLSGITSPVPQGKGVHDALMNADSYAHFVVHMGL